MASRNRNRSKSNTARKQAARSRQARAARREITRGPASPLQADGRLDWRGVELASIAQTGDGHLPAARLIDLPSPMHGVLIAAFCAVGLALTANRSLALVALLAAAVLGIPQARQELRMVVTASVAVVSSLACWVLMRTWELLSGDVHFAQAAIITVVFVIALTSVGDLLRRAAKMQQSKERLMIGLFGMGAGCQALAVMVSLAAGATLLLAVLLPSSSPFN